MFPNRKLSDALKGMHQSMAASQHLDALDGVGGVVQLPKSHVVARALKERNLPDQPLENHLVAVRIVDERGHRGRV